MNSKTRNIINWGLSGVLAFVFVGSGLFKLSGSSGTIEMAKSLGGTVNLVTLGVLELLIALLFLIPRTGIIGALLMIAYMGGAMAVHFVTGQPIIVLVVIEILIWIVSALRFPELVQRLQGQQRK